MICRQIDKYSTCPGCKNHSPDQIEQTDTWREFDTQGYDYLCLKCNTRYSVKYRLKFINKMRLD